MQKFGQGLGEAIAVGIGGTLAKIIIIFVFAFLIVLAFGLLSFGLAVFFYKRKKPKSFLVSGILSALSISVVTSLILSSKLTSGLSLFVPLAPTFFIIGIVIVVRKYRKLKI